MKWKKKKKNREKENRTARYSQRLERSVVEQRRRPLTAIGAEVLKERNWKNTRSFEGAQHSFEQVFVHAEDQRFN